MIDPTIKANWLIALDTDLTVIGARTWEQKLISMLEVFQQTGGSRTQINKAQTRLDSLRAAIAERS